MPGCAAGLADVNFAMLAVDAREVATTVLQRQSAARRPLANLLFAEAGAKSRADGSFDTAGGSAVEGALQM
jgi:hypothetical protein